MSGHILHTLLHALRHSIPEAQESMHTYFRDHQIEAAEKTIMVCATVAAASGVAAGWFPGVGSIVAIGTMTVTVWTMYVKVNKDLGISIKKNLLKFIASAFVSNLAANVGSVAAWLGIAFLLSLIPGGGSVPSAIINGIMGFVVTYASAILYINLLTKMFKAKGSVDAFTDKDELKTMIDEVNQEADLKGIVKEAKAEYKKAKKSGDLDRAKAQCKNEENLSK